MNFPQACFACEKPIEAAGMDDDINTAVDMAITFRGKPTRYSRAFDSSKYSANKYSLQITVCDECLSAHARLIAVARRVTAPEEGAEFVDYVEVEKAS